MAVIVMGIFIIIVVALLIIFCFRKITEVIPALVLLTIGFIIILVTSLFVGKSIAKKDTVKYLTEKEQIEYILENKISLYSIEKAKEYNRKVQNGNNYWCRFNIEDRSAYLIDIDSYIKLER